MRAGKKAVIFGACALLAAVFFFIAVVDAVVANGRAMQDASDVPDGFLTPVVIEGSISGGVVTMSVRGLGGDTAVRGADAVDAAVGAASRNSELDAGRLIIDAITGSVLYSSGGAVSFSASNKTGMTIPVQMPLPPCPPAKDNVFSYMPMLSQGLYSTRLSTSSAQFRFNIKCYTDGEGFRRYGDSYLVAMGQAYGTKVGDKKLLSFRQDDGTTLTISAVSGDFKAIHDTDASNRYHLSDGTIVEFIMGSRDGGHMKRINDKFGQLVSIAKIGTECTLAGSIGEDDAVSLSGNIDGIGLAASGRYDRGSGRFTANGIYGNGGDLSGASADALRSADFAAVYAEAAQHLGKRYVLGTQGPDTFDCSGLVYYVYRRTLYPGLDRRTADSYFNLCARVTGTPMPGDLAFFDSMPGNDRYVDHVGIYIGDGKMLNAPNSKSVVRIESLWGSLVGYGRFPDALRTTR